MELIPTFYATSTLNQPKNGNIRSIVVEIIVNLLKFIRVSKQTLTSIKKEGLTTQLAVEVIEKTRSLLH